jgi:hypothetical protein
MENTTNLFWECGTENSKHIVQLPPGQAFGPSQKNLLPERPRRVAGAGQGLPAALRGGAAPARPLLGRRRWG